MAGGFLAVLLLGASLKGSTQNDPFYKATYQWLSFAYTQQWDSALYSARQLRSLVQKEFGSTGLHYSLLLSGILGQTYFAGKKNDSAIACYQAGMDGFRRRRDTIGEVYKEIALQWRILHVWQTEDTIVQVKDSAWISQRLAEINNLRNTPVSKEWVMQQMRRLKDSTRRPIHNPLLDTAYLTRIRKAFDPPWYAGRVLQESLVLQNDSPDTLDDRQLSFFFDRERWNARTTSLIGDLVPERFATDTVPELVFEYLLAGSRLLKKWLTDRQQTATRQIIYNQNFHNDKNPFPQQQQPPDPQPPSPFSERNINPKTLIERGRSLLANRRYADAEKTFRKLLVRLRTDQQTYSSGYQESMAGLCTALMGLENYREAADSLLVISRVALDHQLESLLTTNEAGQLRYKQAMSVILDLLYTCLCKLPGEEDRLSADIFGLQLRLQNEVLDNMADLLQKIRDSGNAYLSAYFHIFTQIRSAVDSQYMLPLNLRHLNRDSLDRILQVVDAFIFNNSLLNRNPDTPVDVRRLIRGQPPGTTGIAFVRFHYRPIPESDSVAYGAFLLRQQDSIPIFLPLCGEKDLLALMLDKNGQRIESEQLSRDLYDPASPGARRLYQLIWAPLEPWLDKAQTINYSSAGLLDNISFHAIYTGKGYLMVRYNLHRYLKLRETAAHPTAPPLPWPVHLWGNMKYGAGGPNAFPSLGTQEMDSLRRCFHLQHPKISEGDSATEEAFRRQAPAFSGILHISTHGIYFPFDRRDRDSPLPARFLAANADPFLRCGLVFSGVDRYWTTGRPDPGGQDGFLSGSEIARLDLHRVQLVTLSACETGLGDLTGDEGNWGLPRAFKLAGAQHLLVSLWPVSPAVTSRLLSLFYANWLRGMPLSDALRSAEQTLQQNNGKPHPLSPYRWAGFVLIE
jgi:CHAT domain-containing protein